MAAIKYIETFRAPSEYERQLAEARRRQALAEALEAQAYQPMEGNVAPIPRAAPLVKALQGYLTAREGRMAKEAAAEAEKAGRQEFTDYIRSFEPEQRTVGMGEIAAMEAPMPMINTTPGGPAPVQAGQPGFRATEYAQPSAIAAPNQRLMPAMTATGEPDFSQPMQMQVGGPLTTAQKRARALEGFESANPMVQQFAMAQYEKTMPRELDLKLAPINPAEVDMASFAEAQTTGDIRKIKMLPKAPDLPSDVQSYEYYVNQEKRLKRTPKTFEEYKTAQRPTTNINVPGQKTVDAYTTELSKSLAAQDSAAIAAGDSALQQIETSYLVRDLLKQNPITGTGAEARLAFEKALSTAGFTKGNRTEVTENLIALLGKTTLAAIPTSGLGSGQGFTGSDREFLQDAAAGRIEKSNANLQRLAELNERAARLRIQQSNIARKRIREMPDFVRIPGILPDIVAPPVYGSQLPPGATLDLR